MDAEVKPRRYASRLVRHQEGSATRSFPPSILAALLIIAIVWFIAPELLRDDVRPLVAARIASVVNGVSTVVQRRILREALGLSAIRLENSDEAVAEASPQHAAVRPPTTRQNANASVVRRNPASPEPTDAPPLSSSPDGVALQDDIAAGIEIPPNMHGAIFLTGS